MKTLVLFVGGVGSICAQTHPDFSGTWVRVSQSCRTHEKSAGSLQLVVVQQEPALSVTTRSPVKGTTRELALAYKTSGEELHYTGLDGDDFRSRLHWQGSDLVFDIVEQESGSEIHAQEVWKLQDGKLLRSKTVSRPKEHSTCTSVFKQPAVTSSAQGGQ